MKNNFSIAGVFLLAAIWFIVSDAVVKSYEYSDFRDDPMHHQSPALPDLSPKLFCNTAQAESVFNSFNNLPVPNFNDPFSEPGAINKAIEQILEGGFTQYFRHSINFLIHYRKSDIIFPFHYFW
ncbi:MAG: hypothetical protein WD578_02480 [Bacteroidales bacterium]